LGFPVEYRTKPIVLSPILECYLVEMEDKDRELYDETLKTYSSIIRAKYGSKSEILECIKIFEYFEEYEKCDDLLKLLETLNDKKSGKRGK